MTLRKSFISMLHRFQDKIIYTSESGTKVEITLEASYPINDIEKTAQSLKEKRIRECRIEKIFHAGKQTCYIITVSGAWAIGLYEECPFLKEQVEKGVYTC